MTQEIEIEFKNLITEDEFNCLLNELPFPVEGETQINYYFETKEFALKAHKSALRIRKKNDTYRLTLKEPWKTGLLETHDALTKQEAEAMLEGRSIYKKAVGQQLANKNIFFDDLMYYGSLKTIRREINYKGALLVLDYSIYNETADYEMELEAPAAEMGKIVFENLLKEYQIPKRKTANKIERFFSIF